MTEQTKDPAEAEGTETPAAAATPDLAEQEAFVRRLIREESKGAFEELLGELDGSTGEKDDPGERDPGPGARSRATAPAKPTRPGDIGFFSFLFGQRR